MPTNVEHLKPLTMVKALSILLLLSIGLTLSLYADRKLAYSIEYPHLSLHWMLRGTYAPEAGIIIVDIDQRSIDAVGPWPWKRQRLAQLLDEIARLGPTALGITVLFSETADPVDDRALLSSIQRIGRVVLGSLKSPHFPSYLNKEIDPTAFGYLNVNRGHYGQVIGLPPEMGNDGQWAFGIQIARHLSENLPAPISDAGMIRINYNATGGTLLHISAETILRRTSTVSLTGKTVIVDAPFASFQSQTPVGPMTVAEIQANVIQNALEGVWLRWEWKLTLIFAALGGMAGFLCRKKQRIVALLLMLVSYIVVFHIMLVETGMFPCTVVVFLCVASGIVIRDVIRRVGN